MLLQHLIRRTGVCSIFHNIFSREVSRFQSLELCYQTTETLGGRDKDEIAQDLQDNRTRLSDSTEFTAKTTHYLQDLSF